MDKITYEEAMILFQLPRKLPYVSFYCKTDKKTKYASLKEDDPYTITLERASEIVEEKKEADRNKVIKAFDEDPEIQIHNGRWGPYLTNGTKNAKLTKEQKEDPLKIDFETAKKLIDEAPEKRGRFKKKAASKKKAVAKKATAKKKTSKKKAKKKASKKKASAKKASAKKKAAAKKSATPDGDGSGKVSA